MGALYSPNVAYLARYRISSLKDVIKYFTTFFASNFFPYFLPLKPRCILRSEKCGTFEHIWYKKFSITNNYET